jgi:hypothetical protein
VGESCPFTLDSGRFWLSLRYGHLLASL